MRVGVLFSGGKDSTYACCRAMEAEEVVCLITVTSNNPDSYMFHTPNIHLTGLQAEAIGLPLVSVASQGVKEEELADLRRAILQAVEKYGVEGIVSGAILSVYQATRIQRLCLVLGLWCFNPLWHTNQEEYLSNLLAGGFEIIITGVFAAPLDERWLGRTMDKATLVSLRSIVQSHGITLTGEGGEYETFVSDAPFFRKRIEILQAHTTYRAHHGRYLIERARLVPK
ncbi:MAG: diphthine--ammonia ligase [Methanomicrobiales archaeon]|nr:diphthine--ammonia ligase [Methanomicrobiales archaeon]